MQIELTSEELETLKELFNDWGSDQPYADYAKVRALAEKLGFWEPEPDPTEEELKRREEFINSPIGKIMSELFKRNNEFIAKTLLDRKLDVKFTKGDADNNYQWNDKIGSSLRIRLPNDYVVKDNNILLVNKDDSEKA